MFHHYSVIQFSDYFPPVFDVTICFDYEIIMTVLSRRNIKCRPNYNVILFGNDSSRRLYLGEGHGVADDSQCQVCTKCGSCGKKHILTSCLLSVFLSQCTMCDSFITN